MTTEEGAQVIVDRWRLWLDNRHIARVCVCVCVCVCSICLCSFFVIRPEQGAEWDFRNE